MSVAELEAWGRIFQRIGEAGYKTKLRYSGSAGAKSDAYIRQFLIYKRLAFVLPRKVGVISFVENKDKRTKVVLKAVAPDYEALTRCLDTDDIKSMFDISKEIICPEEIY
ncbi:MAG: hypothetical protein QME47_06020 [Candidatus Thermoplasmatota archaeon]|nr:hypothetical protein [Candidatus Thermoplasmatota archaeon]